MAEVPSTNEVSEAGSFVVLSGKTQDSWENLVSDSDSDDEDDVRSLLSDTEQTFDDGLRRLSEGIQAVGVELMGELGAADGLAEQGRHKEWR